MLAKLLYYKSNVGKKVRAWTSGRMQEINII